MLTYSLVANSASIQRSDGAFIPADPNNTDYANYLAWVAAGNTPTPQPGTPLATAQQQQVTTISNACQDAIYSGFSSSALGAVYHYPALDRDQSNLAAAVFAAISAGQSTVVWVASTLCQAGMLIAANGQININLTKGTCGPSAPTWPSTVGTIALDGAATWEIWTTPLWCRNQSGVWSLQQHTSSQVQQVGQDALTARTTYQAKNAALAAQIMAATTVTAVQATVWS
jgi:hypothetical protein